MKKTRLVCLMMALLIFAGCQNTQPTNAPEPTTSASSETKENPCPLKVKDEPSQSEDSSSQETLAPKPDGLPATIPEAIALPDQLFTSSDGYGLELLTPAQYFIKQDSELDGFEQVDVFRLKSKDGEKFALANENGKIITDFLYDDDSESWLLRSDNSGIALRKDGKYGVIDGRTGEEKISFQYDKIQVQPSNTFICVTGDVHELIDASGNVLLTYTRGDKLRVFSDNFMLLANGMLRFYDLNAQPLKNFACEDVRSYLSAEIVFVNCGGKWGICDADGDFLIEPQYDGLDDFNEHCEAVVFTQNGKKGVLDLNGDVLIKAEWDDVALYDTSASVEQDGKWGAFTSITDEELTIEPMYDYVYAFGSDGCAAYEHKGKFGVLDEQGNVLISAKYETMASNSADQLDKGYYVLEGDGSDLSGIISGKGNIVVPATYTIAFGQDEDEPYHLIQNQREKWGYIDRTGQMVIDTKFDDAGEFLPNNDLAFVRQNDKICLIDRKGTVVLETAFTDLAAYNPKTMVGAFSYTDAGKEKYCLAKVTVKS